MKKIAFYLFYDKNGIIDDYIFYKLEKLNKFVDKIIFISNSEINDKSKRKLNLIVDDILLRDNIGFDVWGYKDGLEYVGAEIKEYDEAIFLNYTFFGPIFPFDEMFQWSDENDFDFWGITDHKEVVPNPFTGTGVLPRHIQSHFIAVKSKLLHSIDFKDYWNKMPMINSYQDSILNHESKFTEYFSKKGYTYDVYCNSDEYLSDYPAFIDINATIKHRCPIIKRRPFFHDPLWIDRNAIDLRETLNLVKDISDYDPELIYNNLLRTTKPKDLATNLSLLKIFDSSSEQKTRDDLKIAVLAHVYYPDMIAEMLEQVENIPNQYDLYITTASKENKIFIEDFLNHSDSHFSKFEVRVVEYNRGRDISALLITCRDVILDGNYDLICRLHSKKSPQNNLNQSLHFKKQMYDNLVYDRAYTSKLINFIDSDEKIGFLAPPMVHIGGYPTLGHSWFTNKFDAEQIAKRLDVKIPFDDFSPFAAYGTMFWFRPNALKRLFNENWKWEEFNKEPGHNDGSLSHIIERLLIYVAHDSGYKCFNVMSADMAEYNYTKLEYKAQRIMSNLPNGLVQEQANMLQSQLLGAEHHLSLQWKMVRLLKSHLVINHRDFAMKLVRPYKVLVRIYLSILGK